MDRIREFAPGDKAGAAVFLRDIKGVYDQVCIEEGDNTGWRTVYEGPIEPALERLARLEEGVRFRMRAVHT